MIRMAIIGFGVMGQNHFRVLEEMDGVDVVSVCDSNVTESFGVKLYQDVDTMLSNESIDAAILAVPTFLHKDIGLKVIEKGIDLLIEKPIAANSADGRELRDWAVRHNVKLVVGYIERYNPVVVAIKNEVAGKEIFSVNITRIGPIPPRISDVGVLTDLSVHDIDLIRYITGREIEEIKIFKSQKIQHHHEDNAIIAIRLQNNIVGNITTNWLTPFKKRVIEVSTADEYFEADLIDQTLNAYSSSKYIDISHSYVVRNCFVRKGEPLVFELKAFLDYISGKPINSLATADDSIKTLEILGF